MQLCSHILLTLVLLLAFLCAGCAIFKNTPVIDEPEMVYVEGGTFTMGDVIDEKNEDSLPLHQVRLDDFLIGKYEVTFEQYDSYARLNNLPLPEDDGRGRGERAVARVSWSEAFAYCNFFGYRLPTEQEWEYAARDRGRNMTFAGTNSADSLKYFAITEFTYSFFTGSKKPNKLGLYDMSGNVYEWIGDYYQFYENPDVLHDLENSAVRIVRGGSFSGDSHLAKKTFWRTGVLADIREYDIGFRCATSAN